MSQRDGQPAGARRWNEQMAVCPPGGGGVGRADEQVGQCQREANRLAGIRPLASSATIDIAHH